MIYGTLALPRNNADFRPNYPSSHDLSRASFFPACLASSNSVGSVNTDDGQPIGGRGAALYNYGPDGTVVFKGLANFKNNVGALVKTYEYEIE